MRTNKAWKKFRELKLVFCAKRIGLNVKGTVYELVSEVVWCIVAKHGAKSVENVRKLENTNQNAKDDMWHHTVR